MSIDVASVNCPRCGAPPEPFNPERYGSQKWQCGSTKRRADESVNESRDCLLNQLANLTKTVRSIVQGIMEDESWYDGWCVVCHEHTDSHAKDCPMAALSKVV